MKDTWGGEYKAGTRESRMKFYLRKMKGRKTPHCVRAVDRRNQSSSVRAAPTDGTAAENVR